MARFDAAAMFLGVGTDHLDFHRFCTDGSGGCAPNGLAESRISSYFIRRTQEFTGQPISRDTG